MLPAGTRVGRYEVQGFIGRGGMGEVYRARDVELARDVALKILPDAFATDADRLARFRREAQVLASLNHPHIATIYGVEQSASGSEHTSLRALALEFVDGSTLAERIADGPLPVSDVIAVAAQTIDALDAAHTQGIVHRDLKPANIKLRPDGSVKILDFGLAKSFESDDDQAHSPTMTAVSHSGVILGTAAYMSPEQARGKRVDKRSDIWAFGCVLYEMLTGRTAFGSDTTTDTLSAVVSRDPDWSRLPAATPAGLRRLLEHALAKDSKQRLRDIGDARFYLREPDSTPLQQSLARPRSLTAWQATAAAATLAAAWLGVQAWRAAPAAPAPEPTRQLVRLTADSGYTTEPSMSADGRLLAYASDRAGTGNLDVWVQQTAGGGAVQLTTDPTDDRQPSVSPDGTRIAFRSDRRGGGVYVSPALGGDARLVGPEGRAPKFSPDGRSVAYWTGSSLAVRGLGNVRRTFIVDMNGSAPVQVGRALASSGDPVWAPSGQSLLVYGREAAGAQPDWWLLSVADDTLRRTNAFEAFAAAGLEVLDTDLHPFPESWTGTGVLFSASPRGSDVKNVWRVDLDENAGKLIGPPRAVTMGTTVDERPASAGDGNLVFAGLMRERLILGQPLDANRGHPTGPVRVLRSHLGEIVRTTVSLDGNLLAYPRYEADSASVWFADLRTGADRQLVSTRRTPLNPIISDDGRWVAYTVSARDRGGQAGAGEGFVLKVDGGSPRKVCDDCELYQWLDSNRYVVALPSDGRTVQVINVENGHVDDVFPFKDVEAGHVAADPVLATGGTYGRPLISPDGRLIAFSYRNRTYVSALASHRAAPPADWRLALAPARAGERICGWSPDGRLLYFLLERDGFRCLHALRVDPLSGQPVGEIFAVAHFHDGSRQWGSTGFSSAVVNGLFVFNQVGLSGNIWMLR